ncbi:MAG: 16S rRNA (uracil(1498)-N(3))-methyltransferase [Betaproteobacteria bacterium]
MPAGLNRVPRFHVQGSLAPGAQFSLAPDASHHATRVLRLREGDAIVVFDGSGGEYAATIVHMQRGGLDLQVGAFNPIERESPLAVTLVQAISAGDRMDLTIQKAVELGASSIQPVLAERSVVRLKGERSDNRRDHWQRIAVAACEQCGRNRVPTVATAVEVTGYAAPADALKLLLSPGAATRLSSAGATSAKPIVIAAGPEAGFSPREEAMLVAAGFASVQLGPRVLRTETAAPAALAALNALYGDA